MDGSFFGIRRGELMGYTFPKGLKIVTEQGENARFAADFLKDEIFFRSGQSFPWKMQHRQTGKQRLEKVRSFFRQTVNWKKKPSH